METLIDLFDFGPPLGHHEAGRLGGLFALIFQAFEHGVRPLRRQREWPKQFGDLRRKGFFADVGLRALNSFVLLGTAVVGVPFLDLGGDGTAALATAKKPEQGLRCATLRLRRIPKAAIEHGLDLVKELLGYPSVGEPVCRVSDDCL